MPTTVFGQAVGLFAFFGLSVALLRFAVRCTASGIPTGITTIRLSTPATPAYTKSDVAPATRYKYQLQNPALKIAGV
jgi:hypothetical protein